MTHKRVSPLFSRWKVLTSGPEGPFHGNGRNQLLHHPRRLEGFSPHRSCWITPMATVPKGTKGHFCSRIGWWWAKTHRYCILLYYCGLLGVAVMVVLLQGCWQFSICQSTRFRNFNRVFFLYSLVFSLSFPVFHFPALLVTSHLCTFQISQIAFWLHTGTIGSFAHGAGELSRRAVGLKSQSWWHCTKQYQAA